ncbi:chemotaxis protein CheA [Tissierella sp. P1]|jgi:two-component system chemotaxis sensor kinase CheA|uniref:chemotaxis protein CheA n=1 Tax=Tissierella TaxID=41273 RepID=UPI000BA03EED|nr:chemotaxis protein CheA [Tissierella sp. P1]MDU5079901.1 chemotaxis protein CheA [Bacillota bacterium]OZV12924.1 chemotaxis protein CheA [Tissierella sp. P1]
MDLDISQYINIFVEEAKEHLQNMNDVLLELEKNPSHLGHINEIFRVAHTIKGMSGTMGFHNMANLTHEMENVLQAARNNDIELSENIIDILFECFDALDSSVSHIIDFGTEEDDNNQIIINKLTNLLNEEKNGKHENIPVDDLKIDNFVLEAVNKAKKEGLNIYRIDFVLSESCMLKSARAFIIFNTLETFGEIIYSNPSVEDIEDEKFDLKFSVLLVSDNDKSIILSELNQISEIENITLTDSEDNNSNKIIEPKESEIPTDSNIIMDEVNVKSEKTTQTHSGKVGKTVRVDIDRLDNLMNLVSELIIIKTRMDDLSEKTTGENMTEAIEYLERITTNLHDAVMKVRMVPIERVFNRFPRLVRDLSKELGKEIDLQMSGEETEVDRTVIDEIGDPLIHMIRNSIDHGIELPADRIKIGKPEVGTVVLKSYPDGNNVVIEVEDDGRGMDHNLIKRKAVEKGILDEREAENLSIEDSINLLFEPGFSTAETISDVSGRGVGLDVVKSKIESINGNIEIESVKDKGTKFIIRIPLTLAIIQALLIKLNDEIYAIPLSSITEIINISNDQIRDVQGQEIVLYRGMTLPIIRLKDILGIDDNRESEDLVVVVVKKGDKQAGLIVDNLIGQQEIVIKGLGKYLGGVKYLSGATILGNGNISLILDINSLI